MITGAGGPAGAHRGLRRRRSHATPPRPDPAGSAPARTGPGCLLPPDVRGPDRDDLAVKARRRHTTTSAPFGRAALWFGLTSPAGSGRGWPPTPPRPIPHPDGRRHDLDAHGDARRCGQAGGPGQPTARWRPCPGAATPAPVPAISIPLAVSRAPATLPRPARAIAPRAPGDRPSPGQPGRHERRHGSDAVRDPCEREYPITNDKVTTHQECLRHSELLARQRHPLRPPPRNKTVIRGQDRGKVRTHDSARTSPLCCRCQVVVWGFFEAAAECAARR